MKKNVRLIATDLDGTLLKDDKTLSTKDLLALQSVKDIMVRVAVTGRSLFKVKDVLPNDVPLDYVIFSSGAGVYDWKNKKLLQAEKFDSSNSQQLLKHLLEGETNFFVFHPIPNNNKFYYHKGADDCSEFDNYLQRHKGDYQQLASNEEVKEAGQVLVVIKNDAGLFERLKAEIYSDCDRVRVIRATSPINDAYIWLEVFPETVSKGHGIQWLCDHLSIDYEQTAGVGNDYNDIDMFRFVAHPFVVANGVDEMKQKFTPLIRTNNEGALEEALHLLLGR